MAVWVRFRCAPRTRSDCGCCGRAPRSTSRAAADRHKILSLPLKAYNAETLLLIGQNTIGRRVPGSLQIPSGLCSVPASIALSIALQNAVSIFSISARKRFSSITVSSRIILKSP